MSTIYTADTSRLTVAKAKQLMVAALSDDLPGYVSFLGKLNSAGEVDWVFDNPTLETFRETSKSCLNNKFLELCKSAGFEPHLSIDPTVAGYRLTEHDDLQYMITHAQLVKLAEIYSLCVEIGDVSKQSITQPQGAQTLPAETEPAPVMPVSRMVKWSVKPSLERAPGYRWPLHQFLKAAYIAGQSCPKAREVLDAWAIKPPPDVQVMTDGVKYNDGLGNPKEANLKAIQQAIKNLLQ